MLYKNRVNVKPIGLISLRIERFRVHRSAPPLAAEPASLIKSETPAWRSQIRGLKNAENLRPSGGWCPLRKELKTQRVGLPGNPRFVHAQRMPALQDL
jgi:hypothetical protein